LADYASLIRPTRSLLLQHPAVIVLAGEAAAAAAARGLLARGFAVGEEVVDRRARGAVEVHSAGAELADRAHRLAGDRDEVVGGLARPGTGL